MKQKFSTENPNPMRELRIMVRDYWDYCISVLHSTVEMDDDVELEFLIKLDAKQKIAQTQMPKEYEEYLEMLSINDPDSYFLLTEEQITNE